MSADEVFERIVNEGLNRFFEKNPDFATYLGLHEPYDYMLPKGSTERFLENLQLLENLLRQLDEKVNREKLSFERQIDWEVLEKAYERWKFDFYEWRIHELNPDVSEELGSLIFIMFARDYAPLEKRVDAMAARMEKMPKYLEEFRSRFEKSQPVKLWTKLAIEKAENMMGLFTFISQAVKGKVSDKVYERLQKAVERLQPELKAHLEWLNGLLNKASEEWALGREKFEKLLRLRELGMSSEEILQLGIKYLDELKAEREKLARQIAPGKTVDEVLKMIESKAPKTFEEALEYTRKVMEEARRFIQEKGIATVYPEDVLLVEETPAFMAPLLPFAAMIMPAKYDKPQIGIYIVTRPKDPANLGKHLNYSSIRNTAVHEAFPGHFLQGAISNRGSVVRLLADGAETVEGWAHYCEELLWEKGFITDLETRLVQVNDMIWRAVRIIVDVKLSRGEMTFEEAVEVLMKEAGMSREAATAEVNRYTQTPGYPLSYLLGKHLILKLKEEVKQKMGSKFNEKFFHDTILANGYLPLSMLRKIFDQKIRGLQAS
ncbi:MAG: DUF885 domain-containing protein [Candidatus Bathyarchaeota archaeon]|nr:DUF885 domain-containing protein [Candidatus Bathyarchaeota archaeon]